MGGKYVHFITVGQVTFFRYFGLGDYEILFVLVYFDKSLSLFFFSFVYLVYFTCIHTFICRYLHTYIYVYFLYFLKYIWIARLVACQNMYILTGCKFHYLRGTTVNALDGLEIRRAQQETLFIGHESKIYNLASRCRATWSNSQLVEMPFRRIISACLLCKHYLITNVFNELTHQLR